MRIATHLHFCGQCQEAFEFYRGQLGGTISSMLTYGDSPEAENVPVEFHNKIIHGTFNVSNIEIAGADVLPNQYEQPKGFHLILQLDDESKAERIFNALSEDGKITMPLGKTFWSPCYGILVDKFGISWEINCESA
jgi:PhnB protein